MVMSVSDGDVCACASVVALQQEGTDGQNGGDREVLKRAHSQHPYRPAQEQSVLKAGYCVKQGAVVSDDTLITAHGSLLYLRMDV